MCGALENGARLTTAVPQAHWIYVDQSHCNQSLSMSCYFQRERDACASARDIQGEQRVNLTKYNGFALDDCPTLIRDPSNKTEVGALRAAGMEYLFSGGLTEVVRDEVAKQTQLVFGQATVPPDLITVHIRWGDKKKEMKLVLINK